MYAPSHQSISTIHSIERPWNEALSSKIAEVQDSFKSIPSTLYFSPSSVTFDGIGVYAAETLPKGAWPYTQVHFMYSNFITNRLINSISLIFHLYMYSVINIDITVVD